MKFIVASVIIFVSFTLTGQADYKANFLKKWANAADYTIECAEAMPEELYNYKPTEDAMTFKEQLLHMVGNMMWLSTDYLKGEDHNFDLKNSDYSKQEVIEILSKTFELSTQAVEKLEIERMTEVVDFFAGPMEIQQIMILMNDHMTNHRGQILMYMRINDIKAPKYRGW